MHFLSPLLFSTSRSRHFEGQLRDEESERERDIINKKRARSRSSERKRGLVMHVLLFIISLLYFCLS